MNRYGKLWWMILLLITVALVACERQLGDEEASPTTDPSPGVTAEPYPGQSGEPGEQVTVTPITLPPTPTLVGQEPGEDPQVFPTAVAENVTPPPDSGPRFQVAFVEENDVLNVRRGAGVNHGIVTGLAPSTRGIAITGRGEEVAGSLWVPIQVGQASGWVNSRFLIQQVPEDIFCQANEPLQLLDQLRTAVAEEDGQLLREIVDSERGLRLRRHWWNPQQHFFAGEIGNLFADQNSYNWGTAPGSGDSLAGTFGQIIEPLLVQNLLPPTEIACNIILQGGTAGLVQVPPLYEGINYYSLYRAPGPDQSEFEWGTWVVGIEYWQGRYVISYLVHYEWEI